MLMSSTLLVSCMSRPLSSPQPSLRLHFAEIMVCGNYARTLTVEDLRSIREAALNEKKITLPISIVDVESPGHVRVSTTESKVVGRQFIMFHFEAHKKNGLWVIDQKSIERNEGSISDPNNRNAITVD